MGKVLTILSGMGALIAIFLIVNNGSQSAKIIDSIGGTTIRGVKTLQGR